MTLVRRKLSNKYSYKCPTGKRRFSSESSAYLEMLRVNDEGYARELKRVYRCERCGGWHCTSKEG